MQLFSYSGEKNRKGQWVATKEYYYSGRDEAEQKTDGEYADDMEEFVSGIEIESIIVDPAAASFIVELKKGASRLRRQRTMFLMGYVLLEIFLIWELYYFLKIARKRLKNLVPISGMKRQWNVEMISR